MSAEEDAAQQPPPGGDRAQAPKFTSSFINKNDAGKKFAPKAARRRPGAGAPSAPKPAAAEPAASTASAASTVSTAEPQTSQAQPLTAPAAEPQSEPQLPTPAPTQEATPHGAVQAEELPEQPIPAPPLPTDSTTVPLPSTVPANTEPPAVPANNGNAHHDREPGNVAPLFRPLVRPAEEELDASRPPKRQRSEAPRETDAAHPVPESTPIPPESTVRNGPVPLQLPQVEAAPSSPPTPEQTDHIAALPSAAGRTIVETPASAPEATGQETEDAQPPASEVQPAQTNRTRRGGRWTTVNQHNEEQTEVVETGRAKRVSARTRNRKANTLREIEEEEAQEGEEDEATEATTKRPSAKARGKRKATDVSVGEFIEDGTTQPPAKKARKPRKDKGTKKKRLAEQGNGQEEGENAEGEVRPKKKRRKKDSQVVDGGEGQESGRPRRRGRIREATPSDAEHEVIEPGTTFMDDLASRNIRVGKLSHREKKMRKINWEEVKQRRREKQALEVNDGRNTQNELEEQLRQAGETRMEASQQTSGPRMQLIDGQIIVEPDSGAIDREGDADREIELMEEVEEDDLTKRITSHSFIRNNKRNPKEFMLPGQGKRWNKDDTDKFYQAIEMWGTAFEMIAPMFPGTTRRSIKKKFVREEHLDPERIKRALQKQDSAIDWEQYLKDTNKQEDAFKDPDEIMRELEEERRLMEIQIEAARQQAEEEQANQRAAAALGDEETQDKENGKGRKKKKKDATKQVSFEPEEGVEILGEVGDDPTWAQE